MKKGKLKGFTLLELIIVLAIFSIIMYSITQLLDPVSKFFVRSSNFETTTACIDNMTRAIEGNLQYADRIRAYAAFEPGNLSGTPIETQNDSVTGAALSDMLSDDLKNQIRSFYNDFFADRCYLGCKGQIHVLIFDNDHHVADDVALNYGKLSDYSENFANSGKIIRLTFDFDNYEGNKTADEVLANGSAECWYVNQKLYGNYDYTFSLGDSSLAAVPATTTAPVVTTAPTTTTAVVGTTPVETTPPAPVADTFNPSDFVIKIEMAEIRRALGDSAAATKLIRIPDSGQSVFACSMKNVLDNTNTYSSVAFDTILRLDPLGGSEMDPTNVNKYVSSRIGRYNQLSTQEPAAYNGFYFIYTLPDEVVDLDSYDNYASNYADAFVNYIQTST